MKEVFLKKGWAGKTLSRVDSIARINPILEQHNALNYTYDAATARLQNADVRLSLEQHQKIARADAGKLSESILSMGGVPRSGVGMERTDFDPGESSEEIRNTLLRLEEQFLKALADEHGANHQMRNRAILQNVEKNTRARADYLKSAQF
ncbi:MAG: hypothetical protein ACOCSK_01300 [Rhodothermales bacterium]